MSVLGRSGLWRTQEDVQGSTLPLLHMCLGVQQLLVRSILWASGQVFWTLSQTMYLPMCPRLIHSWSRERQSPASLGGGVLCLQVSIMGRDALQTDWGAREWEAGAGPQRLCGLIASVFHRAQATAAMQAAGRLPGQHHGQVPIPRTQRHCRLTFIWRI